eukprot:4406744-Prymnesium_polylepis.1
MRSARRVLAGAARRPPLAIHAVQPSCAARPPCHRHPDASHIRACFGRRRNPRARAGDADGDGLLSRREFSAGLLQLAPSERQRVDAH